MYVMVLQMIQSSTLLHVVFQVPGGPFLDILEFARIPV